LNADAGVARILTPEEAAARLSPPFTVGAHPAPPRPAPPAAPAPEPIDRRPLEVLEAERDKASGILQGLRDRQLSGAAAIAELDRKIAELAETLTPGASLDARRERDRLAFEQTELVDLIERASGLAARAHEVWRLRWSRELARAYQATLADILAKAGASDAAIDAAVLRLLDLVDARYELIEEAKGATDNLNSMTDQAYWIGPSTWMGGVRQPNRGYLPAEVGLDRSRLPSLQSGRPRRFPLGL
jgi:hypothetical protein